MPLVSAGVWFDVTAPDVMRPALPVNVPASGGGFGPPLAPPYLWATVHVDKWYQQPSEPRRPTPPTQQPLAWIGQIFPPVDVFASQFLQYVQASPEPRRPLPGIAALVAGQAPQTMTPDVDLAKLRFLQTPCDVLPRPRPVPYPQNPSEGVPPRVVSFSIDLWYQQPSEPRAPLPPRMDRTVNVQPSPAVALDQRLAWLTVPPIAMPLPRTIQRDTLTLPILTPAMQAVFSWYVTPAAPLPRPALIQATAQSFALGRLPSTVIVTGPFFATAVVIYAAGAVAFDEEQTL